MSAAISTGFIIGPGIGGFLAEFGTRTPFFFAGALGTVAAILTIIFISEPEHAIENNEQPQKRRMVSNVFLRQNISLRLF